MSDLYWLGRGQLLRNIKKVFSGLWSPLLTSSFPPLLLSSSPPLLLSSSPLFLSSSHLPLFISSSTLSLVSPSPPSQVSVYLAFTPPSSLPPSLCLAPSFQFHEGRNVRNARLGQRVKLAAVTHWPCAISIFKAPSHHNVLVNVL